jgi:aspartate/methionine/tyrosine aminotransferase
MIISDEIYNGLIYEGEEHSILEFTDRAFVINGFSKLYAMTGWRLAMLLLPGSISRHADNAAELLYLRIFLRPGRGIAALRDCDQDVQKMLGIYNERACICWSVKADGYCHPP